MNRILHNANVVVAAAEAVAAVVCVECDCTGEGGSMASGGIGD